MAREEVKRVKMKQSAASRAFDILNAVFMVTFCITILMPFWDVVVRSFSRAQDISYMHINLFPKNRHRDHGSRCGAVWQPTP